MGDRGREGAREGNGEKESDQETRMTIVIQPREVMEI